MSEVDYSGQLEAQIFRLAVREEMAVSSQLTANSLQQKIKSFVAQVTGAVSRYAVYPRFYDADGVYTPSIDLPGLFGEDTQALGMACKASQPIHNYIDIGSAACDQWFDPKFDERLTWLRSNHKAGGAYHVINAAWTPYRESLDWYHQMDSGSKEEQVHKWLTQDPNMYAFFRSSKIGFTKKSVTKITMDDLVQMPNKDISWHSPDEEVVWVDSSVKPWNTPSNLVNGVVLDAVWGGHPRRMQLAMDWGLVKKCPIIPYSAKWALSYTASQGECIGAWPGWAARYKTFGISSIVLNSLLELGSTYLPTVPDDFIVGYAIGGDTWAVQVSGDFFKSKYFKTATGGLSAIDVDVWYGGIHDAQVKLGDPNLTIGDVVAPTPQPEPVPTTVSGKVVADVLNVRSAPDASKANVKEQVYKGEALSWDSSTQVMDAAGNVFVKAPERWVAIKSAKGTELVKSDQ